MILLSFEGYENAALEAKVLQAHPKHSYVIYDNFISFVFLPLPSN